MMVTDRDGVSTIRCTVLSPFHKLCHTRFTALCCKIFKSEMALVGMQVKKYSLEFSDNFPSDLFFF